MRMRRRGPVLFVLITLLVASSAVGGAACSTASHPTGDSAGTTRQDGGDDAGYATAATGATVDGAPSDGRAEVPPSDATSSDDASSDPEDATTDGGFRHPGILVGAEQLAFVKAQIAADAGPWEAAFQKAKSSKYGQVGYTPTPRADVDCGSSSVPDNGCTNEMDDAIAAYTNALLYVFTDDDAYAQTAIRIMNAWSAVLTEHTNSNADLQAAWVGSVFPRAAEIIRATSTDWAPSDQAAFAAMLRTAFLPYVIEGSNANGNWELSMAEACVAMGVFLDDPMTFETGLALWRGRTPAYLYLSSDGPTPVPPPHSTKSGASLDNYWYDAGRYVDGLCQETCRDLVHVQLGVGAMINAAETAHLQGVDLYGEQATRIATGLEWNAQWLNDAAVPSWLCGTGTLTSARPETTWEISRNEFVVRLGQAMPQTNAVAARIRPTGTSLHLDWETLTHYDVGNGDGAP